MNKSTAKKLPVVLTREEARRLLAQPNRRYPTGLRNYTMMAVMYRAGLRVSEVLALEPAHIDANRSHIRVVNGKGAKDRVVPVEPWLIDAIAKWQEVRNSLPGATKALFVSLKGTPLDDRYVRAMVAREAKAAGIDKRVHPHTLRHSYATDLLDEGFTIREVQELLGHSDLSTTMIYTAVNPTHVGEKIRQRAAL